MPISDLEPGVTSTPQYLSYCWQKKSSSRPKMNEHKTYVTFFRFKVRVHLILLSNFDPLIALSYAPSPYARTSSVAFEEDFLQSPDMAMSSKSADLSSSPTRSRAPVNGEAITTSNHRILEFTLSSPEKETPKSKAAASNSAVESRRGSASGSTANAHINEIFHLKSIINSQLTAMTEQQLQIEKQKKMLKDFKDENEMVSIPRLVRKSLIPQ